MELPIDFMKQNGSMLRVKRELFCSIKFHAHLTNKRYNLHIQQIRFFSKYLFNIKIQLMQNVTQPIISKIIHCIGISERPMASKVVCSG